MKGRIPPALPNIGDEEKEAVMDVLSSGQLSMGPRVKEFEKNFAKYIGVKEAVAVSSGTAALHTALMAAGIGKGSKVMVPAYSFFATVSTVFAVGAEPVFADIDPESFCIAPGSMEDIQAVIPVHLYGNPADMEHINSTAAEHDVTVIEDACQAHGAEYQGKKTGALGHIGCFSFYATKNMVTGEGGMLTTDDSELAEKARLLRAHGMDERGVHTLIGHNFLMTDIEAAIGIEQLKKLDDMNDRRRYNANVLDSVLAELEGTVKRPVEIQGGKHVYHQYALRVPSDIRDRIIGGMHRAGIGLRTGYTLPLYKQEAIDMELECLETEKACREVIWAPVFPQLEKSDMYHIAHSLTRFIEYVKG